MPPVDPTAQTLEAWAKELKEKSGGKIAVDFSFGGALAPGPKLYDALLSGTCDMIFFMPYQTPGRFPFCDSFTLPVKSIDPTAATSTKALMDMKAKGYFDKEFADVKLLFLWAPTPSNFFWSKQKVLTVADFAGKKIKYSGGPAQDAIKALGGVPVAMGTAEVYDALQKGTVEGALTGYSVVLPYKLQEVIKDVTIVDFFSVVFAVAMNKNTYNKLPADVKAVFDGTDYGKWAAYGAKSFDDSEAAGRKTFAEAGIPADPLPAAELAKMDTVLAPIWTKWIADMEAKGLPAKQYLADLYASLKGLGVNTPFIGYKP